MKPILAGAFGRSERMVGRRIAGEYILVPLVGRGADIDSIFNLNRVGAFVWEQLDGRTNGSEIVDGLVERFAVDRETAEADYVGFIEQLRSIGAVTGPTALSSLTARFPDASLPRGMAMAGALGQEEKEVFAAYLAKNHLKRSEQREVILDAFLRSERHLSVDDLLQIVQKKRPDVGRTTVYRTLKLLAAAGLASELALDGQTRFELDYKRAHHDHFFCKSCGDIFEFSSPDIERLQEEIAAGIGFVIDGHRHHIFGFCRRCVARSGASRQG